MIDKTKSYTKPTLELYGAIADLTAAGSGLEQEGSMTGGGNSMGAGPLSRRP